MSGPLIECVPNVGEGRRGAVIEHIASAAGAGPGVRLIDASPDPDHNRTVLTFAGTADGVYAAACRATEASVAAIDLRRHTGVQPRIGAVDVVPFVALYDASMDACVAPAALRLRTLRAEQILDPERLAADLDGGPGAASRR